MQFLFDQAGDQHYIRLRMVALSESAGPQLKGFQYDKLDRLGLISLPDENDGYFFPGMHILPQLTDLG